MSDSTFFDNLAPVYDRMINWPRRLAQERPWFESIFQRLSASSALDASCGSGGHLALLAGLAGRLDAADASAAMLALARERAGRLPEAQRPRLLHAGWAGLPEAAGRVYDVVFCLGNSLPYVTDAAELRGSLRGLWGCVAPGGALVIQYKNFARRQAGQGRLLPISGDFAEDRAAADAPAGEKGAVPEQTDHVIARVYDWTGDAQGELILFTILALSRPAPGASWGLWQHVTPLRPWPAARVMEELAALDARTELYGSLALTPFDPAESEDIVLWATRD